jgi:hypothetical protein
MIKIVKNSLLRRVSGVPIRSVPMQLPTRLSATEFFRSSVFCNTEKWSRCITTSGAVRSAEKSGADATNTGELYVSHTVSCPKLHLCFSFMSLVSTEQCGSHPLSSEPGPECHC